MDSSFLIPITGLITALGGGIAWWFNRADKRRDNVEMNAIELLKQSLKEAQDSAATRESELKASAAKRETELKSELDELDEYCSAVKLAAGKWREQIIARGDIPDPVDWPRRSNGRH